MSVELRVSWQREGQRRKSRLYQTPEAAARFALILQGRIAEAFPDKDPDDYACCPGRREDACGCGGVTNAEAWARESARIPPLVFGPFVHRREVSDWDPVS